MVLKSLRSSVSCWSIALESNFHNQEQPETDPPPPLYRRFFPTLTIDMITLQSWHTVGGSVQG